MQYASYIRVSTQRQGESGLGLEAQQAAVARFVQSRTTEPYAVSEFREIESGKRNDRPVLAAAIAYCKRENATLVIAKLDRLARNVAFIANLMESDVEFICCDLPQANRLLLHIMAAVAENEAQMISERTKAALAAAKARGTALGATNPKCRNLDEAARNRGCVAAGEVAHRDAVEYYARFVPWIRKCRAAGRSWDGIAADFNAQGHVTRGGYLFKGPTVRRILVRAERQEP